MEVDAIEVHTIISEIRGWIEAAEERLFYDPSPRRSSHRTAQPNPTPFSVWWPDCQACRSFIEGTRFSEIGGRKWYTSAKDEASKSGSFTPCHVCWIILKARLATGIWPWISNGTDAEIDSGFNDDTDGHQRTRQDIFVFHSERGDLFPPSSSDIFDTGRYVVPSWQIDFSRIRSMLSDCESSHGKKCKEGIISTRMDSELILIDVRDRCLARRDPHLPYVALSYVVSSNRTRFCAENARMALSQRRTAICRDYPRLTAL
jgi:hypothetical protein